jgi:effector-binding domain-containing protein
LLEPVGDATRVTWFFDSNVTEGVGFFDALLARYFSLLFDRWVGGDYELGLARLKEFAESIPVTSFSQLQIERMDVGGQDILYVGVATSQDPADIVEAMAQAYAHISDFMFQAGIERSAPPVAITRAWVEGGYEFDAAIPVQAIPEELPEGIVAGRSPSGTALRAVHRGAYDQILPTYEKLAAYMAAHGLEQRGVSWEQYMSDPATTVEAERETHVYIMLEPASDQ